LTGASPYPYGASYYPLVYPEGDWERDLALMAESGLNVIRTGDCHGAWDRIEPVPGHLRLDLLDRFYKVADRYGIQILLSTGVAMPPVWLAEQHPDVPILSSRGERYPLAASYHWACIHHPGYLEAAGRYTETLARFAAAQPNHFGWQISNEMGFPFLPTREQNTLDLFCYCGHCQERFRRWLQQRYGTLERLNEEWTWSTSAFYHTNWNQVVPPEAMPRSWSGVTRWIDWRLFWQAAFTDFARWQHDLVKQHDPGHPTCVNTFNFKGFDRFGTFCGQDQWQLSGVTDHIGYDLYPGSGDKLKSRPEHISIFLDHGRSVSRAAGKTFWVPELESGPIGGWVLGPEHNTNTDDILRYTMECLGHDAKLMVYMGWKEWDFQSLHWGALVDLDSEPTSRLGAAEAVARYIRRNESFLLEAKVPPGEVALLESKPNAIFFRGIDQEETLFAAQRGAYNAFWELGYRVDFISPAQVLSGDPLPYKAVCLPLMGAVSLELARALERYVASGGILIGFARCGMIDERGWYHRKMPVPGLREVFGLKILEAEGADSITVSMGGQTLAGHIHFERLALDPDTENLGQFASGEPAVTVHPNGKGYGLYIATQADSGYTSKGSRLLRESAVTVLGRLGVVPEVSLDYQGKQRREVDAHLLRAPGRSTVILTSYRPDVRTVTVNVNSGSRRLVGAAAGFAQPRPLPFSETPDGYLVTVDLAGGPVETVDLIWQDVKEE